MKSDRRGRLRYTPEHKAALVEAYESSGLSGPRFAAVHGVNYQTLASWLQKRKHPVSPKPPGLSEPAFFSFVPAELQQGAVATGLSVLVVTFPGGANITINSPAQARLAAALLRELQPSRPC